MLMTMATLTRIQHQEYRFICDKQFPVNCDLRTTSGLLQKLIKFYQDKQFSTKKYVYIYNVMCDQRSGINIDLAVQALHLFVICFVWESCL